ncbi:hypothetical protein V6Z11_A06G208500 [Gossypium hirsutum]
MIKMSCKYNQSKTKQVSSLYAVQSKQRIINIALAQVTTRVSEWLYLGWVLKARYMGFGSRVRVPEPADSSIFTHYRLIQTEFSSGGYISLWLHGDENLTKT